MDTDKNEKVGFTTNLDKELLKEFKHFCLETDKKVNFYIEQMMREKLGK